MVYSFCVYPARVLVCLPEVETNMQDPGVDLEFKVALRWPETWQYRDFGI